MTKNISFSYLNQIYPVIITYRKTHYLRYRFRNGTFYVSCPFLTSQKKIVEGLNKYAPKLVKNVSSASGDDYIYIFARRIPLTYPGVIPFSDGSKIEYYSKEELHKKLHKWFTKFMTIRNRKYEILMGAPENKIYIRKMVSRYGSNTVNKNRIRYAESLMHYDIEIIDAIIVHELAHCFVHGHNKKFYDLVYKYCPNYDELHKKLDKGIFA